MKDGSVWYAWLSLGFVGGWLWRVFVEALRAAEPPKPCEACARCPLNHDEDPRFPYRRTDGTF